MHSEDKKQGHHHSGGDIKNTHGTRADAPAPQDKAQAPADKATPTPPRHELSLIGTSYLEKIETLAGQAVQLQERLIRCSADLDNYRKRAAREKEEAVKYAGEGFLESLLPAIDSFELGIQSAATTTDAAAIALGMKMAMTQLFQILEQHGISAIDAKGQKFDPNLHDAVSHAEVPDTEEGTVVQQIRKGYKIKGRLLRPASVVVAKGKSVS